MAIISVILTGIFASQIIGSPLLKPISLHLNRRDYTRALGLTNTSPLVATSFGSIFDTNVTFGDQTFPLFIDTGSSDTWVVQKDFTCINRTSGLELSQESCLYGPATYDPSRSSSYEEITDEIFGIQYGDGIASGVMAFEDVTVANMTVRQKVGIAKVSTPMGDGLNSGLFGLGYPALTSAHPGPEQDNTTYWFNRLPYNPLLYTLAEEGLIEPYFSIALARTPQNQTSGFGGYLTLGGLAPVKHSDDWVTVPVEVTEGIPLNFTSGQVVRSYWSTTLDSIVYGPPTTAEQSQDEQNTEIDSTRIQVFFDNGNFLTFLPDRVVAPVNELFSPPGVWSDELGVYVVQCDATAPRFGITLGGQTIFLDGRDLVYQTELGICISNLVPSETISIGDITLNIIGTGFFKNVLSVFDFGKDEMRFARLEGEVCDAFGREE